MGPGGSWSVSERVVFLGVSARRPRSPASDHRHVSVLGSKGECSSVYLCGDNVKLEFHPVLVGMFESLNLSQNQNTDDWE